ncbi:MAG: hydrogenase maturation protease [Promethearchaeota archaeon]
MNELYEKLKIRLKHASKIIFMGIGEEKLRDDGVGPYIIGELLTHFNMENLLNKMILFINAGTDPMARVDEIVKFNPSHLILLDTCTLSKPPGTIAILERENISEFVPISSHTVPIHIVMDFIIKQTPMLDIFMIGFVPESLEGFENLQFYKADKISDDQMSENIDLPFFKINLTKKLEKAALEVINIIKRLINDLIPKI